ncbi:hypothetical protein ACLKA6_014534 [Drosophila palustris]
MQNLLTSGAGAASNQQWNLTTNHLQNQHILHQQQQQQQQLQQPGTQMHQQYENNVTNNNIETSNNNNNNNNNENGPTISNLLSFDSEQLIRINSEDQQMLRLNSEDLQLSNLSISTCSASVLGNTQIILLCEKVAKEDIAVRFYEEKNGVTVWEALGDFQHTDVHKQTAITFKTPRYHSLEITEPAKVFIQLRRPSDGVTSEPLPFEYVPMDSDRHSFSNLLKEKHIEDSFQEILSLERSSSANCKNPFLK